MKQILSAALLVFVIGVVGFVYRNEIEHARIAGGNGFTPIGATACTSEARVCPDGSAVGRFGPDCAFAACPPPNTEIQIGSSTVSFMLPAGYTADANARGSDAAILAAYTKPSSGNNAAHVITLREYPTPSGTTGQKVMLAHAFFTPSGQQATSTTSFKAITVRGLTFYAITLGRFEGQVDSAYYLLRANDVLQFELVERDVTNWTDSNLDVTSLPQRQALLQMLATLQSQ